MNRTPQTGDIIGLYGTIYKVKQWRDTQSGELWPIQGGVKLKCFYEKENIPNMLLLWPLN